MRTLITSLTICFGIIFQIQCLAQVKSGNEWIKANQKYYKIPIFQDGFYRISQAELLAAGIVNVNPKQIQLFHRGIEQAIYISGEEDSVLNVGDYIEFYGQKNDATQDQEMYLPNIQVTNPHYNLFSDTTAYFLTWTSTGSPPKRINTIDTPFLDESIEKFYWVTELKAFSEYYSTGQNYRLGTNEQIYDSRFDRGEGWVSNPIQKNGSRSLTFEVKDVYTTPDDWLQPTANFYVGLVGTVENGDYNAEIWAGKNENQLSLIGSVSRFSHTSGGMSKSLFVSELIGTGKYFVQIKCTQGSFTIVYAQLKYPQKPILHSKDDFRFQLPFSYNKSRFLKIADVPENAELYDITNLNNITKINASILEDTLKATIPIPHFNFSEKKLYLKTNVLTIPDIQQVNFQTIYPLDYDYLIITHPSLRKEAGGYSDIVQAYADYRSSAAGGNYKVLIMNIDDLYNQFSYGEVTPLAIQRFASSHTGNTQFIFLIGKGVALPDGYNNLNIRKNPLHFALNLVPTYGVPASDIALAGNIPIGRISVTQPIQILNYLNKVKEHEAAEPALWQKNILHLVGGVNGQERTSFSTSMDSFKNIAENGILRNKVRTRKKTKNSYNELVNIAQEVNEGIGLITYFGHGSITATDLNFGFVSQDTLGYKNKSKYPFFLINACNIGSIFYGYHSLSEDWLYTPDRGSIGFIAHTALAYSNPVRNYTHIFYTILFSPVYLDKPIGWVLKEVQRWISPTNIIDISNAQQMLLQGDPAIRLFKVNKPDYKLTQSDIIIEDTQSGVISEQTDSLQIRLIATNVGTYVSDTIQLKIKHLRPNSSEDSWSISINGLIHQDTLGLLIDLQDVALESGEHQFDFKIDSEDTVIEMNEGNNLVQIKVQISEPLAVEDEVENLRIYPNPSNGLVYIETEKSTIKSVEVMDISGKKIQKQNISSNPQKVTLDLQNQGNGMYIVKIHSGKAITLKKIVLNK